MQFFLVLLLALAFQAHAANLSSGDVLDPFTSGSFFQDNTPNATAATDTDAIAAIDANRTISINLFSGNNGVVSEGSGSLSFSFNPGTATGEADLTYVFNNPLNLVGGVNAFTFSYDLETNPLTMSVSIDGGTATDYTLATGLGAQASIDLTGVGSIASSLAISFSGFSGQNNLSINSPITAVPEPGTIASLFLLAALLFFAYRRRQHKAQPFNAAFAA